MKERAYERIIENKKKQKEQIAKVEEEIKIQEQISFDYSLLKPLYQKRKKLKEKLIKIDLCLISEKKREIKTKFKPESESVSKMIFWSQIENRRLQIGRSYAGNRLVFEKNKNKEGFFIHAYGPGSLVYCENEKDLKEAKSLATLFAKNLKNSLYNYVSSALTKNVKMIDTSEGKATFKFRESKHERVALDQNLDLFLSYDLFLKKWSVTAKKKENIPFIKLAFVYENNFSEKEQIKGLKDFLKKIKPTYEFIKIEEIKKILPNYFKINQKPLNN